MYGWYAVHAFFLCIFLHLNGEKRVESRKINHDGNEINQNWITLLINNNQTTGETVNADSYSISSELVHKFQPAHGWFFVAFFFVRHT